MAFGAGTQSFVLLDGVNGAGTNISPYTDTMEWAQSVETQEVSTFGTSAKAFVPGLTDGDSLPLGGPLDTPLFSQITAMKAAQAAGSSTFTMVWGPAGSVSGRPKISAETLVTSYSISTGVGGRVEWSGSLQVTGAVTNSTW